MITSPTSTHALMNAGYEDGCVPQISAGGENALNHLVDGSDGDRARDTASQNNPEFEDQAPAQS